MIGAVAAGRTLSPERWDMVERAFASEQVDSAPDLAEEPVLPEVRIRSRERRRPAQGHVVVLDDALKSGKLMAADLARCAPGIETQVLKVRRDMRGLVPRATDVLLVHLGEQPGAAISEAVALGLARPWLELIFFFDEQHCFPEIEVVRRMGFTRVLGLRDLQPWLSSAIVPLCRVARARRALAAAQAQIPSLPEPDPVTAVTLPLPEAEQRFRESYLRALLSQTETQKEAAARAGVPYTTLCSMLKKLALLPAR